MQHDYAILQLVKPTNIRNVGWITNCVHDLDAKRESIALVVNLKLIKIAVQRTRIQLFVGFSDDKQCPIDKVIRDNMPFLYNELWDLALACDNIDLDCIVLTSSIPAFLGTYTNSEKITTIWSAGSNIDLSHCSGSVPYVSLESELHDEVFGVQYLLYDNSRDGNLPRFNKVVLGGTFDHFHNGHKKLLSICFSIAQEEIVCGITSASMLKEKSCANFIESFDERKQHILRFMESIGKQSVRCNPVEIYDSWGPSVTIPDLDAIVVSTEVLKGGRLVNEERVKRGLKPLVVIAVARSQIYTLSSSFMRRKKSAISGSNM